MLRHEQFGQENGAVGRARGRVVLVDVLCWDLVDVSLQWRRRRVMIAQRRKMVIMIISVRKMLVAIVWWRRRVVLVVRCRRMVIMVIRVRRMRDVSVILHSGVIPVIIGCVSHNLARNVTATLLLSPGKSEREKMRIIVLTNHNDKAGPDLPI